MSVIFFIITPPDITKANIKIGSLFLSLIQLNSLKRLLIAIPIIEIIKPIVLPIITSKG